ncbi:hypothetical protein SHIRM173S_03752 [Streptomyces hirsutus]
MTRCSAPAAEGADHEAHAGGGVEPQPVQQGGHVVLDVVHDHQRHLGPLGFGVGEQVDLGALA